MNDAYKSKRKRTIWRCAVVGAAASLLVFSLAYWSRVFDASDDRMKAIAVPLPEDGVRPSIG
jgi:hypothetical protein